MVVTDTRTVLLVEDSPDDVFALRWALKKARITVPLKVVEDGVQAIDYLGGRGGFSDRAEFPVPGLVLLDLKLPYKSGMEILQWIREQPHLAQVPVVVLSGSDEARDHVAAEALGAYGYMVKPPSPEEVAELFAAVGVLPAAAEPRGIQVEA